MRELIAGFCAVCVASSASAQSVGEQFDLVCQAQVTERGAPVPSDHPKYRPAWQIQFRVDLAQGLWCRGTCPYTESIQEASATELRLEDGINPPLYILTKIDRETLTLTNIEEGEYIEGVETPSASYMGACEVRPFSGFSPDSETEMPPPSLSASDTSFRRPPNDRRIFGRSAGDPTDTLIESFERLTIDQQRLVQKIVDALLENGNNNEPEE